MKDDPLSCICNGKEITMHIWILIPVAIAFYDTVLGISLTRVCVNGIHLAIVPKSIEIVCSYVTTSDTFLIIGLPHLLTPGFHKVR